MNKKLFNYLFNIFSFAPYFILLFLKGIEMLITYRIWFLLIFIIFYISNFIIIYLYTKKEKEKEFFVLISKDYNIELFLFYCYIFLLYSLNFNFNFIKFIIISFLTTIFYYLIFDFNPFVIFFGLKPYGFSIPNGNEFTIYCALNINIKPKLYLYANFITDKNLIKFFNKENKNAK